MGSQTSKDNSTDQSNNVKNSILANNSGTKGIGVTLSSLGNIFNDTSSYNGIIFDKSKINHFKTKSEHFNSGQATQEKSVSEEQNKNLIKFEWNEGGKEVFITGSFCEWNKRFKMHKNKYDIFEIELFLPKGKFEFKFIVDDIWLCSSNYPQIKDNRGISNNYIDNTSTNINKKSNLNKIKFNLNQNVNNENKIINSPNEKSNNQSINIDELKRNYNNKYPSKEQLNQEAPKIPDVFEIMMDLNENTNQKYIGNKLFLDFSIINFDDSFKNVLQPVHSYLNHLFTYNNLNNIICNNNNKENDKKKINYIGINCNVKVKNKYISIVYYSPFNKT